MIHFSPIAANIHILTTQNKSSATVLIYIKIHAPED